MPSILFNDKKTIFAFFVYNKTIQSPKITKTKTVSYCIKRFFIHYKCFNVTFNITIKKLLYLKKKIPFCTAFLQQKTNNYKY